MGFTFYNKTYVNINIFPRHKGMEQSLYKLGREKFTTKKGRKLDWN